MEDKANTVATAAAAPQATVKGDVIARAKRIMALVDDYTDKPCMATRATLRVALVDELSATPQVGATLTDEEIRAAWYDYANRNGFDRIDLAGVIGFARGLLSTRISESDDDGRYY